MRKTTAKRFKTKATVNIKENQEEQFISMAKADYHYTGNSFSYKKLEKEKKYEGSFSLFQKPVKQGKQNLGYSTYNKSSKSGYNYVAAHKRSDTHEDEHPSDRNDGDSGHANQLSFSQQKEIDAKFSIFVGSLTEKVKQEDLVKLFSQFGPVKAVVMKKNEDEKFPHDYCFVKFVNIDSVQKALFYPKRLSINGAELNIKPRLATVGKQRNQFEFDSKVPSRYYFEGVPNISFTTILVRNIPSSWGPRDLHKNFSLYGTLVGTFIYTTPDEFGLKQGLVEFTTPKIARDLCQKLPMLRLQEGVLNLMATDVINMSEWLGYTQPSSETYPKFPPGLEINPPKEFEEKDATVVTVDDIELSLLHSGEFLNQFRRFGAIEQLLVIPSASGKGRIKMKFDSVKIARVAREYAVDLKK